MAPCLLTAAMCLVTGSVAAESPNHRLPPSGAICRKILERYRPLAHAHPGERPIDTLVASKSCGVSMGPSTSSVSIDSESDLARYAAAQPHPFSISRGLTGTLQELSDEGGVGTLDKAPNVDYYSISKSEGSEGCLQYTFFQVIRGVATVSPGPLIREENTCGYGGFFASVDKDLVFIQQHYDFLPGMSARIDVSTWDSKDFQTDCGIDLLDEPHFSDKTFNDWQPMCQGDGCDALHKIALDLAKAATQSAANLYEESTQRLTSEEQTQFETMKQALSAHQGAGGTAEITADDSSLTDTSPLLVPYVLQGTNVGMWKGDLEIAAVN